MCLYACVDNTVCMYIFLARFDLISSFGEASDDSPPLKFGFHVEDHKQEEERDRQGDSRCLFIMLPQINKHLWTESLQIYMHFNDPPLFLWTCT